MRGAAQNYVSSWARDPLTEALTEGGNSRHSTSAVRLALFRLGRGATPPVMRPPIDHRKGPASFPLR